MSAFSGYVLEVELTSGVWTDISTRVRFPIKIAQGRPTRFDDVGAGNLTFTLQNYDGAFIPENTSSPYSPNWVEGKRIRFKVTKASVTYTRFYGWIQSIKPKMGRPSITDSTVEVTAADALSLMAQRTMRAMTTEISLWLARTEAVPIDVYEAGETPAGYQTFLTNFSTDSAKGGVTAYYSGDIATLEFGEDETMAIGRHVTSNSGDTGQSCTTVAGFQANTKQIVFFLKCPENQLAAGTWFVCSFHNASMSPICHIAMAINGSTNALFMMDAAGTTNLGIIAGVPFGQWVRLQMLQHATTATTTTVQMSDISTAYTLRTYSSIDIRTIRNMEIPGGTGLQMSQSLGGIISIGTRTPFNSYDGYASAHPYQIWAREQSLMSSISDTDVPSTIHQPGTSTIVAANGHWRGRTALDVAQEMIRSDSGVVWARPRDSHVCWLHHDTVRPATPVVTVDAQGDLAEAPELLRAVDTDPTRVEVKTPIGTVLKVDATAEAGPGSPRRAKTVGTVNGSLTDAGTVATTMLARSSATQISSLAIDLTGPITDHTAALFSEATTLGGLYPTQRIRVSGLPSAFFGATTLDVFVEGWTETYDDDQVTLTLDTSPAS